MRCPRCTTVNGDGATRCGGCGLPIALGEEPPPRPVDTPLSLDRRVSRRAAEPAPRAKEPGPDVSGWEMAPPDGEPFDGEPPEMVPDVIDEPPAVVEDPPVETPALRAFADAPVIAIPPPAATAAPAAGPAAAVEEEAAVHRPPVDPGERLRAAVLVHRNRAPAWRRALSWLLDACLLAALVALLLLPVVGPVVGADAAPLLRSLALPLGLLVALVAFAWQWLGVALAGGTPGLLLAGLRVVGPDGERPAPGRAAVRAALGLPAAGLLGAGLLVALFTRSGQGAHDLGAGTWVVRPARGGRR